jgi:hypothetical protein
VGVTGPNTMGLKTVTEFNSVNMEDDHANKCNVCFTRYLTSMLWVPDLYAKLR